MGQQSLLGEEAPHTHTHANAKPEKGLCSNLRRNPKKAGKVLGVALLLSETICPISLPEADNNAKAYWKIKHLLNRVGLSWDFFFFREEREIVTVCQVSY